MIAFLLSLASQAPLPAVVVLPLQPEGTITVKQAQGLNARLRDVIENGDYAKLLSVSKDDQKQVDQCAREPKCLGELAAMRGADYLVAGTVAAARDGLRVVVVVVVPNATEVLRRVEVTTKGDAADDRRLDRLARSAIDPSALRGAIVVTGEEGASVEVDGKIVGTLPLDKPIEGLSEGDHIVVVRKHGFADDRRIVAVVHGETREVKSLLLPPADGATSSSPPAAEHPPALSTPLVVGGIGAGLLLLGALAGALSLRDALDVENRARQQNLFFPRDSGLLLRGQIFAWSANVLYAGGALTLGAAGILALTEDDA